MRLDIGRPDGPRDIRELSAVLTQGLGFPEERIPQWLESLGADRLRVARHEGAVAGVYGAIDMAMCLGGRSVKAAGITAVAIAPEHRSSGVGSALMRHSLAELRADYPVAALYPATYPIYRRAGYEAAGTRVAYRVTLATLGIREKDDLAVRAAREEDGPLIRALYTERAKRTAGNLDRSPHLWWRVLQRAPPAIHAYIASSDAGPEGYVSFSQKALPTRFPPYEVQVNDLVALTPRAGRRLLRLLADHRSMSRVAVIPGPPAEPLFCLLPEEPLEVETLHRWLVRILDVEAALAQRGYAPSVRGEVRFRVSDDAIPENESVYALAVENGQAAVRKTEAGAEVTLDVRGLASLYTGYLGAEELVATGLVSGEARALAVLTSIFAGPSPWMPEIF
jgi:predicted acetyltransferase